MNYGLGPSMCPLEGQPDICRGYKVGDGETVLGLAHGFYRPCPEGSRELPESFKLTVMNQGSRNPSRSSLKRVLDGAGWLGSQMVSTPYLSTGL